MIIQLKCPQCGAVLNVDRNREFFFCQYCGTKLMNIKEEKTVNINQNVHHSGTVFYQRDTRNDPNLYIEYSTLRPQFPCMITFQRERWILGQGERQSYKLAPGEYVLKFQVAKRSWKRKIIIPENNMPVHIKVVYANRVSIYID